MPYWLTDSFLRGVHAGAGAGQALAPALFWPMKSLFFFTLVLTSSVFYKKSALHYVMSNMRTSKGMKPYRYSDLSISIQFSFSRIFSYRHGQMRQFVVKIVPEESIRFSPVQ